jgi:alkylated DNA repair dioxygenase AlkB
LIKTTYFLQLVSNSFTIMNNERIALTLGDAGENHVGNQMLGEKGEIGSGFTVNDLNIIKSRYEELGYTCEYVDLSSTLNNASNNGRTGDISDWGFNAGVLIIRRFVKKVDRIKLYGEVTSMEWDRKYYDTRRKKVLNKHARGNLVFVDGFEQEPDYENKKGRVVDIKSLETLDRVKTSLLDGISISLENSDSTTKSISYICEGNRYYDLKKCGIGYHGDKERTRVICLSLGVDNYPMNWVWFYRSKPIAPPTEVRLNSGDVYIMSEKAVGYDWAKKVFPTLRHAAGARKYTNLDKYDIPGDNGIKIKLTVKKT